MSLSLSERDLPMAVQARALALTGARGPVYGPLDFDVPAGWVVAAVGAQGTGRTSLLLTLAGRMRPSSGSLRVLGVDPLKRPRVVQTRCAVAGFSPIDTLDEGLRVREVITERADLVVPLWRRPLRVTDPAMGALVDCIFGGDPLDMGAQVASLSALDLARLRVLLALIGNPRLLAVDDMDAVRDPEEQRRLWESLQRVCGRGVTVVAAAASAIAIPGDIRVVHVGRPIVAVAFGDTPEDDTTEDHAPEDHAPEDHAPEAADDTVAPLNRLLQEA
jgi:ABC-type multidrug transport system ATPase subunit